MRIALRVDITEDDFGAAFDLMDGDGRLTDGPFYLQPGGTNWVRGPQGERYPRVRLALFPDVKWPMILKMREAGRLVSW